MPLDDYYSRRGLNHLSPKMGCIGLSWDWGGMGEIAVINDYNANVIPDSVSDEQGALIEPTAVALYGVDRAKVGGGTTVLITGAGPIGALAVLCAHAVGMLDQPGGISATGTGDARKPGTFECSGTGFLPGRYGDLADLPSGGEEKLRTSWGGFQSHQ